MRPEEAKENKPITLKLRIKSSLPNVKSSIALFIILWKVSGETSECEYSESNENSIEIKKSLLQKLLEYFKNEITREIRFEELINDNPLFKSQVESLIVAFELIWKIGKIEFVESGKPKSSERTGNIRYPKKIFFTSNIDLINLLLKKNPEATKNILFSWLTNSEVKQEFNEEEKDLISCLTLLSENSIYRLRPDDISELIFMNVGIYNKIEQGSERIDISDAKEQTGSLRILHNLLNEGLNTYLSKENSEVILAPGVDIDRFTKYKKRVKNYLDLTNISIEEKYQSIIDEKDKRHNRILFGAPGTGKSYILEKQRTIFGDNYERVTFHPDYTYAQFVGSYKPKPKNKNDGTEFISYDYVIGPFLRLLIKALKNPQTKYLLIIEELNRTNTAAVFGDVFQLLDRLPDGSSEYEIATSEEMRKYLIECENFSESSATKIGIPSNYYIWATMNSADQGVFPLDTAFKRRWFFELIGIDEGSEEIEDIKIQLKPFGEIYWNQLRIKINNRLTEVDLNINEDKLIGPFFFKKNELISSNFDEIFKNKLLLYLFEDVLKYRKGKFFKNQFNTISKIFEIYDAGENIFDFEVNEIDSGVNHLSQEE